MKIEFTANMSNEFKVDRKTCDELNKAFRTIVCGTLGIAPDDKDTLWETYTWVTVSSEEGDRND